MIFLVWVVVTLACPVLGVAWVIIWLLALQAEARELARELSTDGGRYRARQELAAQGIPREVIEEMIPFDGWVS